jgi:hypothetical protein
MATTSLTSVGSEADSQVAILTKYFLMTSHKFQFGQLVPPQVHRPQRPARSARRREP